MSELSEYPKDFVERTKEIISNHFENFKKIEREFTFLLNCLLGLIITVSEQHNSIFNSEIDEDFLKYVPDKIGFVILPSIETNLIEGTESIEIKRKSDLIHQKKSWFLTKIRNGIAHQNIEDIEENGKWTSIKIWNQNKNTKDFEIIFTINELKEFAEEIASIYLRE